jgi:hypothetical protein
MLKCDRLALIDELLKKINEMQTSQEDLFRTQFNQMNMLLEHKDRMIGSGNDEGLKVKATAKVIIATNPIEGKNTLASHLLFLDQSTMSRYLIFIQDMSYYKFIQAEKKRQLSSCLRGETLKKFAGGNFPFTPAGNEDIVPNLFSPLDGITANTQKTYAYGIIQKIINRRYNGTSIVDKNKSERYAFISSCYYFFYHTIYDTCQTFLSAYDHKKLIKIFENSCVNLKDPLRSYWMARGIHHTTLLLDGIIKVRCLFTDYDKTFYANDEDYKKLEEMLKYLTSTWKTDLTPKNELDLEGINIWDYGDKK